MFVLRQPFFFQMFNAIFQLYQDEEAMEYLKEIGPDTLVPCFTVNLKDNKSVDVCNAINMAIFQKLSHSSDERTAHRVPMVVTASSMLHHKHSSALKSFKKRLGVSGATIVSLRQRKNFLRGTVSPCEAHHWTQAFINTNRYVFGKFPWAIALSQVVYQWSCQWSAAHSLFTEELSLFLTAVFKKKKKGSAYWQRNYH